MTRGPVSLEIVAQRMRGGGCVVFTGAGMSTDSGLPDFRSAEGLWNKVDPMELATASAMRRDYERFHEFYSFRLEQMLEASPNEGHRIIANWEERGVVSCVVTQNVDELHETAGSRVVHKLHGSVGSVCCMECGRPYSPRDFIAKTPCACGGRLRPGVTLFEESLPEKALGNAWTAAEKCNVLLVLGSSLRVSPANQLPEAARRAGATVAICNREATILDHLAHFVSHGGIVDFLTSLEDILASP